MRKFVSAAHVPKNKDVANGKIFFKPNLLLTHQTDFFSILFKHIFSIFFTDFSTTISKNFSTEVNIWLFILHHTDNKESVEIPQKINT